MFTYFSGEAISKGNRNVDSLSNAIEFVFLIDGNLQTPCYQQICVLFSLIVFVYVCVWVCVGRTINTF